MAFSHSARVMAGPWTKFAVPRRIFFCKMRSPLTGRATPMSTGITSAPASLAMQHTLVSPRDMFSVTIAVTSCPVWVTPSSTTPLSAHMATTARLEISKSALPVIPAMRTTASSSKPRLPKGFATAFQRRTAASSPVREAGVIPASTSCSVTHSLPFSFKKRPLRNEGEDASFFFYACFRRAKCPFFGQRPSRALPPGETRSIFFPPAAEP